MYFETSIASHLGALREKCPLVHCITNYVTVNDCANALLAIGGSPVMADSIKEASEIAAISSALVINIGTLNERTIRSMFIAGKTAVKKGIPVILDPVGAGASKIRTATALSLALSLPVSVIRGNLSEIRAMLGGSGNTRGVDVAEADRGTDAVQCAYDAAKALALKTGAVVAITGETDIVSGGGRTFAIRNGHPLLPRITGSGCMLSAITGAFCGTGSGKLEEKVAASLCAMGLAGELAAQAHGGNPGTGTFRTALIDALSLMDAASLERGMKIEELA